MISGELPLSKGIRKLHRHAFSGNRNITKIVIPKGVEVIPEFCFGGPLDQVEEVVIPDTVKRIEQNAFMALGCPVYIDTEPFWPEPNILKEKGLIMDRSCRLSNVTKNYLSKFNGILDDMIREMTEAERNDSISHNFIVQMIPHHRAAIRMSKNILKYTTDVSLQDIAEGIVSAQTKSIEDMEKILGCCGERKDCEQDLCLYQRRTDQIMQVMFSQMGCARATNEINCDFMWEMIPHHMGAVEMSKNALQYDICPELKPILEAIITSQERGIMEMRNLLRCLGCC